MSVSALIDDVSKLSEEEKNEFIVGVVSKMSVLNLSNLVKKIETKFDVKAAGGGPQFVPPQPQKTEDAPVEKTDFTVFIKAIDAAKKIAIIKEVRAITGLGLTQAKDLVERAPAIVKDKVAKVDAENMQKQLEAVGATIELR